MQNKKSVASFLFCSLHLPHTPYSILNTLSYLLNDKAHQGDLSAGRQGQKIAGQRPHVFIRL